MCYECYEEYGKPAVINEKTILVAKLIDEIYEFDGAGGRCHIVIDDYNIEDESINFCIDLIEKDYKNILYSEEQNRIQLECMKIFMFLSEEERMSALAIHEGWIKI